MMSGDPAVMMLSQICGGPAADALPSRRAVAARSPARSMAEFAAADGRGSARQGRPDRLLDLFLHQLPACDPLCPRLGGEVQGSGPGRDRCACARIRLREEYRQCPPRHKGPEGRLSRRDRQRLCDLAGVSTISTGRRTTSSTRRDASATTISAKANTTNPNRSSSSCWRRPATGMSPAGCLGDRPWRGGGRRCDGNVNRRKPMSAMSAPRTSHPRRRRAGASHAYAHAGDRCREINGR